MLIILLEIVLESLIYQMIEKDEILPFVFQGLG